MGSRAACERFAYTTPQHLIDAAFRICKEEDREYPYLAEFHLEDDGTHALFALHTVSRSYSPYHQEDRVGTSGWDVDWIKSYGFYAYHMSSGGGSLRHEVEGIYWRHPEMRHLVREKTNRRGHKEFKKRNKTRRLRRIPAQFSERDDLMVFLDRTGVRSSVYYCDICGEHLPDEDNCNHVWWCDLDAILRGPGSTEEKLPCSDEDCSCYYYYKDEGPNA